MKKISLGIIAATLLLAILSLAGCKSGGDSEDENSAFAGTVLEAFEASLLVEPDEGSWVRNSSDKVSVSIWHCYYHCRNCTLSNRNVALSSFGAKDIPFTTFTSGLDSCAFTTGLLFA